MTKLYFNGDIVPCPGDAAVEALVTDGDTVAFIGDKKTAEQRFWEAERIDLHGATMLPAFLDAHGHFAAVAKSYLEIDGDCPLPEMLERIQVCAESERQPGEWITVRDFDHMRCGRYVTCGELDEAAPHNPVVVQHTSRHMGVFNSKGLQEIGWQSETADGYLEESAFIESVRKIPLPTGDAFLRAADKAQTVYLSHGITTVQEGMAMAELLPVYRDLYEHPPVVDIVLYTDQAALPAYKTFLAHDRYCNGLRLGGVKVILDGSPQAGTAWLRMPYADGSNGQPSMPDEQLLAAVRLAYDEHMQLLAHCNGDAAAEQFLRVLFAFGKWFPDDRRPVMIHA